MLSLSLRYTYDAFLIFAPYFLRLTRRYGFDFSSRYFLSLSFITVYFLRFSPGCHARDAVSLSCFAAFHMPLALYATLLIWRLRLLRHTITRYDIHADMLLMAAAGLFRCC